MPQLAQVNEKMKLTSSKLVRHFSKSGKNSMLTMFQPLTFQSILLIELLNGPQSTQLLIRAQMCLAIDQTFKMDESVPLGPDEN